MSYGRKFLFAKGCGNPAPTNTERVEIYRREAAKFRGEGREDIAQMYERLILELSEVGS